VTEAQKQARKALIAACVGLLCFGFILGVLAIKWGRDARTSLIAAGVAEGRGLATAAIILGTIDIVFWVIGIAIRISGA
jgi:hypothetical protein